MKLRKRRLHNNVSPPKPNHDWERVDGKTICKSCGERMPVARQIEACPSPSASELRRQRNGR
jgi:hypothetical protein